MATNGIFGRGIYGQGVPRQTYGGKDLYADQVMARDNKYDNGITDYAAYDANIADRVQANNNLNSGGGSRGGGSNTIGKILGGVGAAAGLYDLGTNLGLFGGGKAVADAAGGLATTVAPAVTNTLGGSGAAVQGGAGQLTAPGELVPESIQAGGELSAPVTSAVSAPIPSSTGGVFNIPGSNVASGTYGISGSGATGAATGAFNAVPGFTGLSGGAYGVGGAGALGAGVAPTAAVNAGMFAPSVYSAALAPTVEAGMFAPSVYSATVAPGIGTGGAVGSGAAGAAGAGSSSGLGGFSAGSMGSGLAGAAALAVPILLGLFGGKEQPSTVNADQDRFDDLNQEVFDDLYNGRDIDQYHDDVMAAQAPTLPSERAKDDYFQDNPGDSAEGWDQMVSNNDYQARLNATDLAFKKGNDFWNADGSNKETVHVAGMKQDYYDRQGIQNPAPGSPAPIVQPYVAPPAPIVQPAPYIAPPAPYVQPYVAPRRNPYVYDRNDDYNSTGGMRGGH